jgi:hypothetical protein
MSQLGPNAFREPLDPDQVAQAIVGCWQDEEVTGRRSTTSA